MSHMDLRKRHRTQFCSVATEDEVNIMHKAGRPEVGSVT